MGQGVSGESSWRRSRIVQGVTSPAAGADWSQAVPAGHLWQLLAVTATLTTSAVVANRSAKLILGDGTNTFLTIPAAVVQAASLGGVYSWAVGANPASLGAVQLGPLPDLVLPPAWTIGVSTALLDVGDAWTAIRLHLVDVTARRGRIDLDTVPDMIVGVVELGPDQPA